jgi:hypothetical protein
MPSKKLIFSTLVIIFSFQFQQKTYCQVNFQPGIVISKSGDSLKGLIDYRNWEKNPTEISFTESDKSVPLKYNPASINGFIVNNEVYLSAVVVAEISPRNFNELDLQSKILTRTDTTFVQVIFQGSKNLYFYSDNNGGENFYIGQWPELELLVYKKYLKQGQREKVVAEYRNFIGQLKLYLQNCSSAQKKINNTSYTKHDLESLFKEYYACTEDKISYKSVQDKPRFDFGALAGVSVTKLSLSSSVSGFDHIANIDYSASWKFSGGLYMDFVFARNQRKWSIYNELLLSSYHANGQSVEYHNQNYYKNYFISIGYSYLKLNNMLRFTYPVFSKDFFIFIDAGISNGLAITETNSMTEEIVFYADPKTTEEPAMAETRIYEQGFIAGLGVKYLKFSFETRYEGGNGMSVYTSLNSETNRLYFLFGYRF